MEESSFKAHNAQNPVCNVHLSQAQVPLHALHAGGLPPGFMPQQHQGGLGGSGAAGGAPGGMVPSNTMAPSTLVSSGMSPDVSPSPRKPASPLERNSAERREVGIGV